MHRLRSANSIIRFKVASWGLFLMLLLAPPALGMTICGFFMWDIWLLKVALCLIVAILTLGIIRWIFALGARCPLCLIHLMLGQSCSKNAKAKVFLGSCRLRVACCIISRKYFCCPYCGESTVMEVRPAAVRFRKRT